MNTRPIPTTGEQLPVIGLGTWQTFDVPGPAAPRLAEVLRPFAGAGGKVIDTSPMYGKAEERVGEGREHVPGAFLATKVWTSGRDHGIEQMRRSMHLLRAEVVDLMQIHNLLDWRTHLRTLREWKEAGRFRYIGITHYQASAFPKLEEILSHEELDFVQLPLSVELPDAETSLLPLCQSRRVAVLVNRPFEDGKMFETVNGRPLPPWAADIDCTSWGQIFLKYVLAHPAVTCAIPATGKLKHLQDNLAAGRGRLPDEKIRKQIV
ncbi:MAG TPA: aldo/keto reductase, partial [Thermoanaerobaculia bacterium]|nr:aldo/keto reductase [Thermoanaerobaculia bacterium]